MRTPDELAVDLKGIVRVSVTPRMTMAAYRVLSRWYASNDKATSGESMCELAEEIMLAGLNASVEAK